MDAKHHKVLRGLLILIAIKIAILFKFSMLSIKYINFPQYKNYSFWHSNYTQIKGPKRKTFLISSWTDLFSKDREKFSGSKLFENCLHKNCIISFNRTLVNQSKLILFKWDGILRKKVDLPPRGDNQLWAFVTNESPDTDRVIRGVGRYLKYNKMFNLTITYRTDSTIYMPYTVLNLRKRNVPKDFRSVMAIVKNKTKTAAWFVSGPIDLSSRRTVVDELIRHGFSVDIFGNDEKLKCPKSENERCIKMLETDYKFYLSFENSNCKDYITEKLFKVLPIHVVPIVLGGGNYRSLLPKQAYIDVSDFISIKELAQYLISLDKDDEKYLKYLSWRCEYDLQMIDGVQSAFCNICQKLNEGTLRSDPRTSADIKSWWLTKKCLSSQNSSHREVIDRFFHY